MSRKLLFRTLVTVGSALFAASSIHTAAKAGPDDDERVNISINHHNDGETTGQFWVNGDALNLRAKWRGVFDFNDAATGFEDFDGRLEIEHRGDKRRRLVVRGEDDAIEREYFVSGRKQEIGAAEESDIANLVRLFALESGYGADRRVAKLFEEGGATAVYDEIGEITTSHARRKYLTTLAEAHALTEVEIDQYAAFIDEFEGDHEARKAILAAYEEQEDLSMASRARLLRAGRNIESDHEARKILVAAAGAPLSDDAAMMAMSMLRDIESDHEFRKCAIAFLKNETFTEQQSLEVLTLAAEDVDSDHELRKIVVAASDAARASDEIAGAAVGAARAIESDHERRKSVAVLASALPQGSAHWRSLIEAADDIGSDHEKRKALRVIWGRMPDDASLIAPYRSAAEGIGSEHEREKALAGVR